MPNAFDEFDVATVRPNAFDEFDRKPNSFDEFDSGVTTAPEQPRFKVPPNPSIATGFPTAAGGPRVPVASLAETIQEPIQAVGETLTHPSPIPTPFTIDKNDNPFVATGKEVVNLAVGIPQFFTSGPGIAAAGAGIAAPTITAAVFTADMLHSLGKQIKSTYQNWDEMTPAEKSVAVTDIGGTGLMAAMTGHATIKGLSGVGESFVPRGTGIEPTVKPDFKELQVVAPLTATEVAKTEGEPNAIPIKGANEEVLRNESAGTEQNVGLSEVGARNAEPEVAAQPQTAPGGETKYEVGPGITGSVGAAAAGSTEFVRGTHLKKITGALEREQMGLPAPYDKITRPIQQVAQEASDILSKDPEAGRKIADALKWNPERGMTDVDSALLLSHKEDLINRRNQAASDTITAKTPEAKAEAETRFAGLNDQLVDILDAAKFRGSQWGREGIWQQVLKAEDFSLERMVSDKQASLGRKLDPNVPEDAAILKQLKDQADRIAELERQLKERQTQTQQQGRLDVLNSGIEEAKKTVAGEKKSKSEPDPAKVEETISKQLKDRSGDEDFSLESISNLVHRLALNFVRKGITERMPLVDAVRDFLKEFIPDLTRESVMDAISGFGRSTKLDKEPAKVILRDLKGQMQQLGKMLKIVREEPIPKTGPERRVPSAEERQFTKMVNRFKKVLGVVVTDPAAQLKSSLDAIKTRMRNEIEEIEHAIASKTPRVRTGGGVELDAEAKALKAQLEQKRADYAELFPKQPLTDAERIAKAGKVLDRQIEEVQRQLKSGEIFPPGKKPSQVPADAGLEAKKAQLEALKAEREWTREALQPDIEPHEKALLNWKLRALNKIAELQDRLARGDFEKPVRTPKFEPDRRAQEIQTQLEGVKKQYQQGLRMDQFKKMTPLDKGIYWFLKFRRGIGVLSSPISFVKLFGAAILRLGSLPIEEAIGHAERLIPDWAAIMRKAPIEGGGFSAELANSYVEASKFVMKDAWNTLRSGKSDLDVAWGKNNGLPPEAVEIFGRMHAVMKSPVKRYAFEFALKRQAQWNIKNGIDITDPAVSLSMHLRAYEWANRQIFLNNNAAVNGWRAAIRVLENKGPGGKALATAMQYEMPIVSVPTNIVAEALTYALGLPVGAIRARAAIRAGIENLKPEQADQIARSLKKGALGAALFTLGWYGYESIGGFYQPGQRKKNIEGPEFTDIEINGVPISHNLIHAPSILMLQFAATMRRESETPETKAGEEQGKFVGAAHAIWGLGEETPFLRETMELSKFGGERWQFRQALGKQLRDFISPLGLQWAAKMGDLEEGNIFTGEPTRRRASNLKEEIMLGIPGLRQEVPEVKAR